MFIILIITSMLMSAKRNITFSGSKLIFVFSLVNLILNIDIEKVFIGNKYYILMRKSTTRTAEIKNSTLCPPTLTSTRRWELEY